MTLPPSDSVPFAQPLAYSNAARAPGRPGILTALGVVSICIGSLSILASLGGVASAIMYIMLPRMTFPVVAPTTGPAVLAAPPGVSAPGPGGVQTFHASATSFSVTTYGTTSAVTPFPFHVATGASALTIVESTLSLFVAVILLAAGVLMLRDSIKTLRLHRIYVLLKVPLVFVAAFAGWWTMSSMMSGFHQNFVTGAASMPPVAFPNTMATVQAVFIAIIGLIYPVAILIVLSTRTAKEYFTRISAS